MPLPEDFWKTHKLRFSENHIRLGEPVKPKCDYLLTNAEAIAQDGGKKDHNWMEFEAVFPTKQWPDNRCLYDDIPNWSWCNFCGQVNENRPTCVSRIYTANYGSGQCGKGASVEYEGKWYCKTHDPVRIAERHAARELKYRLQQEALAREWKREKEDKEARKELVEAALEALEWMDASGIHKEDEWAATLYRRITAAKGKLDNGTL